MSAAEDAITMEKLEALGNLARRAAENAEDQAQTNRRAINRLTEHMQDMEVRHYEQALRLTRHLEDHIKHCPGHPPKGSETP